MNTIEFSTQMQRLTSTFDKANAFYSAERLQSIWRICENLEVKEMTSIVTDMIDRSREKPMPEDFRRAAAFYLKKNPRIHDTPDKINCGDCQDTGFRWINFENYPAWVFCNCAVGHNKAEIHQNLILPMFCDQIERRSTARPFPNAFFWPSRDSKFDTLVNRWAEFKIDLKASEEFWQSLKRQSALEASEPSAGLLESSASNRAAPLEF